MAVFAIMSGWSRCFVANVSGQDIRGVVISVSLWQLRGVYPYIRLLVPGTNTVSKQLPKKQEVPIKCDNVYGQ